MTSKKQYAPMYYYCDGTKMATSDCIDRKRAALLYAVVYGCSVATEQKRRNRLAIAHNLYYGHMLMEHGIERDRTFDCVNCIG